MSILIKVQSLNVLKPGKALLNNISLDLHEGERLAIIGPNGAGKSSLVKALSNDLEYTGSIHYPLQDAKVSLACCQGVLPQVSTLNFPYLVHEVVALGRLPHSSGRKIDSNICEAAMQLMDVKCLAQCLYTELSGGEKQRVQLARVFCQIWRKQDAPFRCLLLDEPSSALDISHQQLLMDALATFASDGVGIIMVAHDLNHVVNYSDRCLMLKQSNVFALDSSYDLISSEKVSELYEAKVEIIDHPHLKRKYVFI